MALVLQQALVKTRMKPDSLIIESSVTVPSLGFPSLSESTYFLLRTATMFTLGFILLVRLDSRLPQLMNEWQNSRAQLDITHKDPLHTSKLLLYLTMTLPAMEPWWGWQ
jgi:hypothetical protein